MKQQQQQQLQQQQLQQQQLLRIRMRPSEWATQIIRIPIMGGVVPMDFTTRRYLRPIYDSPRDVLLKCGRQVEKTTTLGNLALTFASAVKFFKALYIAPTALQAKMFSEDRLSLPIEYSPALRRIFPKRDQSVQLKRTIIGSSIILRAAFLTAARTRGITANMLVIDEFQDMMPELVPVIEQVVFHAPWSRMLYSGTPLGMENNIEHYWSAFSTQNEWAVPCRRHGTPKDPGSWHWNILGKKNIGKKGLICDRCGQPIYADDPDAKWVRMVDPRGKEDLINFEGFRIPQLMMPFITQPRKWRDVLRKLAQYPSHQFDNEVLGLSASHGMRPLTIEQLYQIMDDQVAFADLDSWVARCHGRVYVGIDWGTDENSRTVITVAGYPERSHDFRVFFSHEFVGPESDPETQMEMIFRLLHHIKPAQIGADYGGGSYQNSQLLKVFGKRVHIYQYVGKQRSGKIVWSNRLDRYILSRSEVMADVFGAMKQGLIRLPRREDYLVPYGQDILNITQEYNHRLETMQYGHPRGRTDDTFHSILYALLASLHDNSRPDIFTPRLGDNPYDDGEDVDKWSDWGL